VLESVIKPITSVSPVGKVSDTGISMTTFACLGKACDVVKLTYNRVVVWTFKSKGDNLTLVRVPYLNS